MCGRVRSCVDVRDADEDVARVCRKRPRRDVNARALWTKNLRKWIFFFHFPRRCSRSQDDGETTPSIKLFLSKDTRATQRAPPALE